MPFHTQRTDKLVLGKSISATNGVFCQRGKMGTGTGQPRTYSLISYYSIVLLWSDGRSYDRISGHRLLGLDGGWVLLTGIQLIQKACAAFR